MKRVLSFATVCVCHISHSKRNFEKFYHKFTKRLRVKYSFFLSNIFISL